MECILIYIKKPGFLEKYPNWISGVANCSTLDDYLSIPSDKLIVTGGWNEYDELWQTEMFDLSNHSLKCQHDMDLTLPLGAAAGGVLSLDDGVQVPIICGGYVNYWMRNYETSCYQLGNANPVAELTFAKFNHAGVVINGGKTLWITGGTDGTVAL